MKTTEVGRGGRRPFTLAFPAEILPECPPGRGHLQLQPGGPPCHLPTSPTPLGGKDLALRFWNKPDWAQGLEPWSPALPHQTEVPAQEGCSCSGLSVRGPRRAWLEGAPGVFPPLQRSSAPATARLPPETLAQLWVSPGHPTGENPPAHSFLAPASGTWWDGWQLRGRVGRDQRQGSQCHLQRLGAHPVLITQDKLSGEAHCPALRESDVGRGG